MLFLYDLTRARARARACVRACVRGNVIESAYGRVLTSKEATKNVIHEMMQRINTKRNQPSSTSLSPSERFLLPEESGVTGCTLAESSDSETHGRRQDANVPLSHTARHVTRYSFVSRRALILFPPVQLLSQHHRVLSG